MSLSKFSKSDELLEEEAIELFIFESIDDFVEDIIPQKEKRSKNQS